MKTRTYKISINNKGSITYTTVSVQAPAGTSAVMSLAESMYGGPGIFISMLGLISEG
jgi:hypothetical protein